MLNFIKNQIASNRLERKLRSVGFSSASVDAVTLDSDNRCASLKVRLTEGSQPIDMQASYELRGDSIRIRNVKSSNRLVSGGGWAAEKLGLNEAKLPSGIGGAMARLFLE